MLFKKILFNIYISLFEYWISNNVFTFHQFNCSLSKYTVN